MTAFFIWLILVGIMMGVSRRISLKRIEKWAYNHERPCINCQYMRIKWYDLLITGGTIQWSTCSSDHAEKIRKQWNIKNISNVPRYCSVERELIGNTLCCQPEGIYYLPLKDKSLPVDMNKSVH